MKKSKPNLKTNQINLIRSILLSAFIVLCYVLFLIFVEVRVYNFDDNHSDIYSEIDFSRRKLDSLDKELSGVYMPFALHMSWLVFKVDLDIINKHDWPALKTEIEKINNANREYLYFNNLNSYQFWYLNQCGIENETEYIELIINRFMYDYQNLLNEYSLEKSRNSELWNQRKGIWENWNAFNLEISKLKKIITYIGFSIVLFIWMLFFYHKDKMFGNNSEFE